MARQGNQVLWLNPKVSAPALLLATAASLDISTLLWALGGRPPPRQKSEDAPPREMPGGRGGESATPPRLKGGPLTLRAVWPTPAFTARAHRPVPGQGPGVFRPAGRTGEQMWGRPVHKRPRSSKTMLLCKCNREGNCLCAFISFTCFGRPSSELGLD